MEKEIINYLTKSFSRLVLTFFLIPLVALLLFSIINPPHRLDDVGGILMLCILPTILYSLITIPIFLLLIEKIRRVKTARILVWTLLPFLFLLVVLAGGFLSFSEDGFNKLSFAAFALIVIQPYIIILTLIKFSKIAAIN